jgi:hypothetical protein
MQKDLLLNANLSSRLEITPGVTKLFPLKICYPGVITPVTPLPQKTWVITPGVTCFCGAQKCYPGNENYPVVTPVLYAT